ncbi:MAG: acylphosphatase [Candidatus Peribacter sp.]|nr:acylphosphatase [Candidatus Peribacter sp.]
MPARHLLITGLVQGVNFRHEAKAKADALHLTGWVRNNDADGSLEMHIEGRPDALKEFEQWCQNGPQPARVENVQAKDDPEDYGKSFVVQMSS